MYGEDMPEEDVRELKRSQEVGGQWFDDCTLEGYRADWVVPNARRRKYRRRLF